MITSRNTFIVSKLKILDISQFFARLNCRCSYSSGFHGELSHKSTKRSRPHRPTRNQLRVAIPFLKHIKECQNSNELLSVFQRYCETGNRPDYPCYASLIYKLAKARKFEDIDTLLNCLRDHDIKCAEHLFIGLIRHYGKAKLVDYAMKVFHDMGRSLNCERTIQSFNTILNVLVDNERISDAVDLFEGGSKMGFKLNSVSFNIMIKMWVEKGDWENARQVFDEMLQREVEPTVVTYNCQIGFLCRRGDVDGAKSLFEDIVKKGKQRNSVTYALLMKGLCSLGRFNEAKKLMFDMEYQGCKVQLVNYGILVTDLTRRGLIDAAKDLLSEMKKRHIKPDVAIYNMLINYFCKEGAPSKGYQILVDMQIKGCEPNAATYRMLIDGFCRIRDFTGGLKILNAMIHSRHFPQTETFQSMFIGLVRSGKMNDAGYILEEMADKRVKLDSSSWEILVREVCIDDQVVDWLLIDIMSSCCCELGVNGS